MLKIMHYRNIMCTSLETIPLRTRMELQYYSIDKQMRLQNGLFPSAYATTTESIEQKTEEFYEQLRIALKYTKKKI